MELMKVYNLEQVAEILQLSKRTVYGYIKAGKIPAVKMGKYWRVTEDNLKAFLSQDVIKGLPAKPKKNKDPKDEKWKPSTGTR